MGDFIWTVHSLRYICCIFKFKIKVYVIVRATWCRAVDSPKPEGTCTLSHGSGLCVSTLLPMGLFVHVLDERHAYY